MRKVFVVISLLFASFSSHAAVVIFATISSSYAWLSPDNSCSNVVLSFNNWAISRGISRRLVSCNTDPVTASTRLTDSGNTYSISGIFDVASLADLQALQSQLDAVVAAAGSGSNTTAADVATLQSQVSSLTGIVDQLTTQLSQFTSATGATIVQSTVHVNDAFGTATPEQYQAMMIIFGLLLSAGAAVWGVRRILKLFSSHAES
jgi:hypothetical protein